MTLAGLAWSGFKLTFGLVSLAGAWSSAVIKNGALWARDTDEEKRELAAAQKRFWSLDAEPIPGFRHAFFKTSGGMRVHYVINVDEKATVAKNIVFFIHGFPDSFLLWRHFLQSPELQRNHILVAVDLPGYGGSDSVPSYGPNEVLETLSEFIIDIRAQFLQDGHKTVAITHDWGAVIGARLASEASVLADHWIITSGIIPSLQASNAANRFKLAKQMLRTWVRSPFNIRLLKNGLHALKPVVSQFRRSFYIFVFHLPWPLNNLFATFGNYWFLRVLHQLGKGPNKTNKNMTTLNPVEAAEAMAISTGPSALELETSIPSSKEEYGDTLWNRLPDRGMSEKIRIYRDNLVFGKWEKSLEITAALYNISSAQTSSGMANTAPMGALKAPATLVMGEKDPAFDKRLAFDGAREWLVGGSAVLVVKGGGHWLPLEHTGRRVLEKTLLWALEKEGKDMPFTGMSDVRVLESV